MPEPRRRRRVASRCNPLRAAVMDALEPRQLLTTFNPADGATLSSILNQSNSGTKLALGDTIILNAGSNYTGAFILKNITTGSGWITIESSNLANLPAGQRVSPSDVSNMATIQAPGSNVSAVQAQYGAAIGAHHFKFLGINFVGPANNSDVTSLMELGTTDSVQNSLTMMPHDFVIDRCYFHPNTPTASVRRAIALNAGATDITNCYIDNIHQEGSDSQAIGGSNGAGPYNIINNYLVAASENVLFGGSGCYIPNTVPSDIVIRGNYFTKPLSWMQATTSGGYSVKNLLEFKEGRRVDIEGNIFENNWNSGQDGTAILFKLDQYSSSRPWQVTEDIIFRNNIVRHAANAIALQGRDYTDNSPAGLVRRLLITNNLFDDINKTPWAIWNNANAIGGNSLYMTQGPQYVTFTHNLIFNSRTTINLDSSNLTYPIVGFVYQNNTAAHNTYGVFSSEYGTGDNSITNYLDANGGAPFTKDILMGGPSSSYKNHPGNYFPAAWSNVGFVDQSNQNYRLTSTSAYHNAATDGTDLGPNFDMLNGMVGYAIDANTGYATAGVMTPYAISGIWPAAYKSGSTLFVHFNNTSTPITVADSGSNVVVTKQGSTPLTFAMAAGDPIQVVDSNADDTLALTAPITQPISFTNGAGNDLVQISGGSYTFNSDLSYSTTAATIQPWQIKDWGVYVAAGASATFNSNQHLRSLSVDGIATLSSGGAKVLWLTDLAVTGKLNLTDNDLIWDYSSGSPIGTWAGNAYTGLTGLIKAGRNGGAWNGNGIITNQSAAQGAVATTSLGVAEASSSLNYNGGATATFDGQTVDSTAVLVKYTYSSDATLDGTTTGDDYFRIDQGFGNHATGFASGDFNLDGKINADDYFLIDRNYARHGSQL